MTKTRHGGSGAPNTEDLRLKYVEGGAALKRYARAAGTLLNLAGYSQHQLQSIAHPKLLEHSTQVCFHGTFGYLK